MTTAHTALMVLPKCDQHGQMVKRDSTTQEHSYCGTWYQCSCCKTTTLLPSIELRAALAAAGAA